MAIVELNTPNQSGLRYTLATDAQGKPRITQTYVVQQSPAFRTQAESLRSNDPTMGHYIFGAFSDGLGWSARNRLTGRGMNGVWDATADTRFRRKTQARRAVSATKESGRDHDRAYINFKGDLIGVFEENYDNGAANQVFTSSYDGNTTWDQSPSGNIISMSGSNAAGARCFHVVTDGTKIYALTNRENSTAEELEYAVSSSSDGSSWTEFSNGPTGTTHVLTTTITRRNNAEDMHLGKLLVFGSLIICAVRDEAVDGQLEVYSTNDEGATSWTSEGSVPDSHVHALLQWVDPYDRTTKIPILVTEYNVYQVDTTNNTLVALFPQGVLTGQANDGNGATIGHDGNLYFGLATGKIMKVQLVGNNDFRFVTIGPPGEGLASGRTGVLEWLSSPPSDWLVAGYADNIFYISYEERRDPETGKVYHPWHSGYFNAGATVYLVGFSTFDDGTPRLHFAESGSSASSTYLIEEPFTDPEVDTSGSTIAYDTSSNYIDLPTEDLGDPHATKTFYSGRVDADDLSSGTAGSGSGTDKFITLKYGLDGNARTTNEVGDFLSGQKSLNLPDNGSSSNAGDSGSKIGIRLLFEGSQNNTGSLYELELLAEPILKTKRAFEFTIDIEQTARDMENGVSVSTEVHEDIIDNLESVAEATTLPTFRSGEDAATLCRVPNNSPPRWDLWVVDSVGEDRGHRTGFCTIRLEEVR